MQKTEKRFKHMRSLMRIEIKENLDLALKNNRKI
jgi:hypothetical protein